MKPLEIINEFDLFLAQKSESFSAIIIGGGALSLMRVITRETQDIDVLDPILPQVILQLSQEFADQINQSTPLALKRTWLNNGPESLRPNLPEGWQDRQDCLLMNPSHNELQEAIVWVKEQDMNPFWPKHVELSLQSLAKELGYGL